MRQGPCHRPGSRRPDHDRCCRGAAIAAAGHAARLAAGRGGRPGPPLLIAVA